MKGTPVTAISIAFLCLAGVAQVRAQKSQGGGFGPGFLPKNIPAPVADSTTDDDLRKRRQSEQFGGLGDKEHKPKTFDLVSTSTFIETGGVFTIVPRGSVLQVPPALSNWVVENPATASKFQPWPEFLQANRGRVSTFEVTTDQAAGKAGIEASKLALAKKPGGLLVAVCRGGPISCITADSSPIPKP